MKFLISLLLFFNLLYSASMSISSSNWELLGASEEIDLATNLSGECFVYTWDKANWSLYGKNSTSSSKKLKPNEGFFAIGVKDCKINFKAAKDAVLPDAIEDSNARFKSITTYDESVLKDNIEQLEWVNSDPGCLPLSSGLEMKDVISSGENHCNNLIFAAQTDWRVATTAEVKTFLEQVDKANIHPYYKNPGCPRLVGFDNKTVSTVNTHNNPPVGLVKPWEKLNAGVRCVRASK